MDVPPGDHGEVFPIRTPGNLPQFARIVELGNRLTSFDVNDIDFPCHVVIVDQGRRGAGHNQTSAVRAPVQR